MEKTVKTKVVASYNGHSIRTNKNVDLVLKCRYDELVNYIQLIQLLNADIKIVTKVEDEKPDNLGTFRIKQITVDHDGEGILKFTSMLDFVNADKLNRLVNTDLFNVQFSATVEIEEEDE